MKKIEWKITSQKMNSALHHSKISSASEKKTHVSRKKETGTAWEERKINYNPKEENKLAISDKKEKGKKRPPSPRKNHCSLDNQKKRSLRSNKWMNNDSKNHKRKFWSPPEVKSP